MDSSLAAEGHNTTCYCSNVVSITKRYFTLLLRVVERVARGQFDFTAG